MKDITIHVQATIKEAMEALNKTAEKVLLVVNETDVLIGALADGDIRRSILKGSDLTDTIQDVFNQNPIFIYEDECDKEGIKKILRENKIDLVPVLDKKHRILDFVTWKKAFGNNRPVKKKKLDAPVVIMAGGKGTRLEPFTKVLPKPLIPIGDKPVINHILEKFRDYDILEFYLTIHHMQKIMRAYFEEIETDYSIEFVEENEPRGTAGGLKPLKAKLNKPFFVSNSDVIIEADYADLYHFHIKNGYDITLVASAKQFDIPYGICKLNNSGSLDRIQEKPEYNFLVNTGLYVLNSDVIDLIPVEGIYHITQLIIDVKKQGMKVGVYPVSENAWVDVGQWVEYQKAVERFG